MPAEQFPDRLGAARRPTSADCWAVVRAYYGGSRTNVLRGRFGRLAVMFPLAFAGLGAFWYSVAPAGMTVPTAWLGLPPVAWFALASLLWIGLALLQPAVSGLRTVRQTDSAVSYVLEGGEGEPSILSAIRFRRVRSGLLVEDHVAAQPGRDWGHRLRAEVGDHVREVCDGHGWTLHVLAVNRGMAERYSAEFDHLVPVERTWAQSAMDRHPLERRPQPVRVGPAGR